MFGLKDICKMVYENASDNSQTITGVLALGGLVATVYLTYVESPKIHKVIDDRNDKLEEIILSSMSAAEKKVAKQELNKETAKELVKAGGPVAASTLITGGLMTATIVISNAKIDKLSQIASISDTAYKAITDNIEAEEKRKEEKKLDLKETEEKPNDNGKGKYLFIDVMFGTIFYSTVNDIKESVIILNDRLSDINNPKRKEVSLNELYDLVGAPKTIIGYDYKWFSDTVETKLILPIVGKRTCSTCMGPAYVLEYGEHPPVYQYC